MRPRRGLRRRWPAPARRGPFAPTTSPHARPSLCLPVPGCMTPPPPLLHGRGGDLRFHGRGRSPGWSAAGRERPAEVDGDTAAARSSDRRVGAPAPMSPRGDEWRAAGTVGRRHARLKEVVPCSASRRWGGVDVSGDNVGKKE
jgi:hypothetical protein